MFEFENTSLLVTDQQCVSIKLYFVFLKLSTHSMLHSTYFLMINIKYLNLKYWLDFY